MTAKLPTKYELRLRLKNMNTRTIEFQLDIIMDDWTRAMLNASLYILWWRHNLFTFIDLNMFVYMSEYTAVYKWGHCVKKKNPGTLTIFFSGADVSKQELFFLF